MVSGLSAGGRQGWQGLVDDVSAGLTVMVGLQRTGKAGDFFSVEVNNISKGLEFF